MQQTEYEQGHKAFDARPEGTSRPGLKGLDVKGCGQERPLDFLLKSYMAKTASYCFYV